ncbi:right-handed parallel beta-helix repeat-containing protein, partial [Bacteroides fluxus]|uniref:right-handed parallel beta-helix repeat-containing protein n=1 Tax=Bacteroides fluxus TaxID=626930 RepID=UPI0023F20ECE
LAHAIDTTIHEKTGFGIENLTWTPQVIFSGNTIRNNRARGALFSTPQDVLVENNLFDHTSGTAILLCGDCNGWYETGACRNVTIRNNRFINALTSLFQFTNAIISIYPEIPNLQAQQNYFHGTVIIENNLFNTFDAPIVYGKSVNTIIFRHNTIQKNRSYFPFHWNRHRFFFERVNNVMIAD